MFARLRNRAQALATKARAAFGRAARSRDADKEVEAPEIEEALAEPILDLTGVHHVSEKLRRAHRGDDEEGAAAGDPSRVLRALRPARRREVAPEREDSLFDLPILEEPKGTRAKRRPRDANDAQAPRKAAAPKKAQDRSHTQTIPISDEDILSIRPIKK
jgi:hypothetical protein